MACLPSELLFNTTCLRSCPKDKYIFKQNCVDRCPPNADILDTEMSKVCYFENEFNCKPNFCDNNYPYCYRMNCLKTCPEYTVEFNHTCLIQCPREAPFVTSYSCDGLCRAGVNSCSKTCPKSHPFTFQTKTLQRCLKYCPEYTEASLENMSCLFKCPLSKPLLFNNTCMKACPSNYMYIAIKESEYNEIMVCTAKCPERTVYDNNRCVTDCPKGKHLFNGTCVSACPKPFTYLYPKNALYKLTDIEKFGHADFMCVEECNTKQNVDYSGKPSQLIHGQTCVEKCPKNASYEFNGQCLSSCPLDHPYEKSSRRSILCINKCENLIYKKRCVFNCPVEARYTQNVSCVSICEGQLPFAYVKIVKGGLFWNEKTNKMEHVREFHCLKNCPINTFNYNDTNCVSSCPLEKNFEMNGSCIESCPDSYDIHLPQGSHFKCIDKCSELTYGKTCVTQCPPKARYVYNVSCVEDCYSDLPYKFDEIIKIRKAYYFSTKVNYRCVKSCPQNTFLYNKTHCVTSCPLDAKYRMNLTCVSECNENFPLRYKTNHIHECLDKCPAKNVIYNASECVSACPVNENFEMNGSCIERCPHSYDKLLPQGSHFKCIDKCTELTYGKMCVSQCPAKANYVYNVSCVENCKNDLPYIIDEVIKTGSNHQIISTINYRCVKTCPPNTFVYNNTHCVSSCPLDAKYRMNLTCVSECNDNYPFEKEHITKSRISYWPTVEYKTCHIHECLEECPSSNVIYNVSKCLKACPLEANFELNGSCHEHCPTRNDYKISVGSYYKCKNECLGMLIFNKTCVSACPLVENFEINGSCHEHCPAYFNYKLQEGSYYKCQSGCFGMLIFNNTCVDACPNEAKYESNGVCEQYCDEYSPNHLTYSEKQKGKVIHYCLGKCPLNTLKFNDSCLTSCPMNSFTFNSTCLMDCPTKMHMNYTKNSKEYGFYTCVQSCPNNTVLYNNTCFDKCPGFLIRHMSSCTKTCPSTHLFTDSRNRSCVQKCETDFVVSKDNFCENKCPKDINFIEDNRCMRTCNSRKAVYEITAQGKVCYTSCPNHLLLMENTNVCVDKCAMEMLIIDAICRQREDCPNHRFIEYSSIGRRCTNRCSNTFYLDGTNCVKECPKQKVIAGGECADTCPPSYPLQYKGYSGSNLTVACYKQCPSGYLANNSKCIQDSDCNHYSYDHVCYEHCPYLTIENKDEMTCEPMTEYIVSAVVCLVVALLLLTCCYFNSCYSGVPSIADKATLQEDENVLLNHEMERSYNNVLMENDVLTENITEHNTECPIQDVVTEIDDGYTISN